MKSQNKLTCVVTAVLILVCLTFSIIAIPASAADFGTHYDSLAAANYAANHWNDGIGVCDEFVKTCLQAGGVEILAGGVDPLKNALLDAGLGRAQELVISSDGVHALASENPNIQSGDILFFYCQRCQRSIHTAILGGCSNNGYLYAYAHNPGWDQVDWFGNFTHTLSSGERHSGCFTYTVVVMDHADYSHTHNFKSGFYEEAHPHPMYAQCSCNAKYYLGWNATVSYCTDCNPPENTAPVVSAEVQDDSIVLTWTTVKDALEYQVWRAKQPDGTYFSIYSAMGTKLTNRSVDPDTDYYYKVIAVLEKDHTGNVIRSAESEVVHCRVNSAGALPGTPVAVGSLQSGTKAVTTWNAVSGAAKYEVWRSASENGTYSRLLTTVNLKCTNTPKPGTYYYKVRALDANGNAGAFSNIVCLSVI